VNAGPVEALSQVGAATENFVQVWDGMTDETEDDTPVVQLAQTEDELVDVEAETCLDVQCKLS